MNSDPNLRGLLPFGINCFNRTAIISPDSQRQQDETGAVLASALRMRTLTRGDSAMAAGRSS